jgi:DNA polymerase-3 subunit epsilon
MKWAVIDSETTGLFDYSKRADEDGQPWLASLAIITLTDDLREESVSDWFVKPDGWSMSEEAGKINGLTDAVLMERGVPVVEVLGEYVRLIDEGYVIAGFGVAYDLKVLRGALRRAGMPDRFEDTLSFCVMQALTDVCKVPRVKSRGYKWPKLSEACNHFGIEQPAAHSSLGDTKSTAELLRKLADLNLLPQTIEKPVSKVML